MNHGSINFTTTNESTTPSDSVRELYDIIDDFECAMLVTREPSSDAVVARPMMILERDDLGRIWFASPLDSDKIEHIEANPEVNVVLQSPASFISLSGQAVWYASDMDLDANWGRRWERWFPERVDDERVGIIKVRIEHGHFWKRSLADRIGGVIAQAQAGAESLISNEPEHPVLEPTGSSAAT